jgi:hypothetical protein
MLNVPRTTKKTFSSYLTVGIDKGIELVTLRFIPRCYSEHSIRGSDRGSKR